MRASRKGHVIAESDDTVVVDQNIDAAWYYPKPKDAATGGEA